MLCAVLVVAVLRSGYFDLAHIDVTGNQAVAEAEIVAASGLSLGSSLLRVSRARVAAGLLGLPRIKRAEVHRQWPRGVAIAIEERTSMLVVPVGQSWLEVATDGVVVALVDGERPGGLPTLEGLATETAAVGEKLPGPAAAAVVVATGAVAAAGEEVAVIRLDPSGIEVELADETLLFLGAPGTDIEVRVEVAVAMLAELRAAGRPVAYIDVRTPGQPVVRPK